MELRGEKIADSIHLRLDFLTTTILRSKGANIGMNGDIIGLLLHLIQGAQSILHTLILHAPEFCMIILFWQIENNIISCF